MLTLPEKIIFFLAALAWVMPEAGGGALQV
jgi:hypothetical protein